MAHPSIPRRWLVTEQALEGSFDLVHHDERLELSGYFPFGVYDEDPGLRLKPPLPHDRYRDQSLAGPRLVQVVRLTVNEDDPVTVLLVQHGELLGHGRAHLGLAEARGGEGDGHRFARRHRFGDGYPVPLRVRRVGGGALRE